MSVFRIAPLALIPLLCTFAPSANAQDVFTNGVQIQDSDPGTVDLFVNSDTTLDGKVCIGNSCTSIETFDANTLVELSEAATQSIEFNDTSSGGFPNRDWRLTINQNLALSSGGMERFAVEDLTEGTIPFLIEGRVPDNALYLAGVTGDVGIGTALPQEKLHIADTASPALRLEQTSAGGGTPYTWDIVSNEFGFVVRDTTNSFALPLFLAAGAPSLSIFLDGAGNTGFGTATPATPLHVVRSGLPAPADPTAPAGILIEASGTNDPRGLLTLRNSGQVFFALEDTSIPAGDNTGRQWNFQNRLGTFRVTTAPGGANEVEMVLDVDGNMTIEGNYFAASGTQLNVPDYVFAPGYDLKPLQDVRTFISENRHLPGVPSADQINAEGLNMTRMQMTLLKKIEELTLYTLAQEEQLAELATLRARVATLEQALARK